MIEPLSSLIHPGLYDAIFQTILHSLWQIPIIALCLKLYSQRPSIKSSFGNYNSSLFAIITSILVAGFTFLYFLMRHDQSVLVVGTNNIIDVHFTNALETVIPSSQPAGTILFSDFLNQYRHYIVLFWAIGCVFLLGRITVGWMGLQFIKRSLSFNVSNQLNTSFVKIRKALGLSESIRIAHSALVTIPMVIGHARPIILLPLATVNRLSTEEVEAILVHEMAHILHYDFIKNLIVMIGEALFFYHPVIWLLSSEIREEREHCCDDTVMKHFPNRIGYAKMLVKLEEIHLGQSNGLSMALFNSKFKLMKRVKRILNSTSEPRLKKTNLAIAALLICSVILFSSAGIINDEQKTEGLNAIDLLEVTGVVSPSNVSSLNLDGMDHTMAQISSVTDQTEYSEKTIEKVVELIPDPVELLLPVKDTIDKEEKEKLKKKLKEKRKELREKTREIRDKMRAQSQKIREEHREELKLKRKELKEIQKKLGKEGHSFYFGDDLEFDFQFDPSEMEEWASQMGEWGAQLSEKIVTQFDEEWVNNMAEMGANLGADIGSNIGDLFDEDWATKWESFGTEFKFNMENSFDEKWAEDMAKMGEEIASSFDEEWVEGMADMGEEISRAVNEAMFEFEDEGYKYSYTFGDVEDARTLKSKLVAQLNKDGLLKDGENDMVITDNEMKVNDVVQSASRLATYKDLIKQHSETAFRKGETEVVFSIKGKSLEGGGHNVLVVDVDKNKNR